MDVNGDPQAPQKIYDGVQGLPGVASVGEPQLNDEETVAIVFVTPDSAPQDEETDQLVDRLRDDVVPAATAGGDAVAYVSGQTAAFKDIADQIMERMPLFLLYIIGVTLIVLAMAFRSIVVSATAAVTTILSAFVGFGVLTLVVQEGHLLGLTGLDKTGPIETFVPPIAFAILFGLSMDYMVFLMSRIREEHVHGLKTRSAVEHGIAAIGRVVVAAALIMGTVFAAFILSADRIPKEFGLLLAVAILTDALIVRMTLVPAFLTLLGEKSWYIPRWLDRLLPNITIEPPHDGEAPGGRSMSGPRGRPGRPALMSHARRRNFDGSAASSSSTSYRSDAKTRAGRATRRAGRGARCRGRSRSPRSPRPLEKTTTCNDHGLEAAVRGRGACTDRTRAIVRLHRDQARPPAADPRPQAPALDLAVVAAATARTAASTTWRRRGGGA